MRNIVIKLGTAFFTGKIKEECVWIFESDDDEREQVCSSLDVRIKAISCFNPGWLVDIFIKDEMEVFSFVLFSLFQKYLIEYSKTYDNISDNLIF